MSDTLTEIDWDNVSPGDLRKITKDALDAKKAAEDRAAQAEAAAADLTREQAFTKAGIPAEGTGALIRKAYDGDPDPDAIKAFAAEHGVTADAPAAPAAPEQPAVPAETIAAAAAVQEAAGGATAPPGEVPLQARLAAANTPEEVMALVEAGGIGADE